MQRERRERVEKARQDRIEALEKELVAKQQRAERLRQERLQSKKCNTTRFSRRPLGPDGVAGDGATLNLGSETARLGPPKRSAPQPHTMPSMVRELCRPVKEADSEQPIIFEPTSTKVLSRAASACESKAGSACASEKASVKSVDQARPASQSGRSLSRWQKYLPGSMKSSSGVADENSLRNLAKPHGFRATEAYVPTFSMRACDPTPHSFGDLTTHADDIWTGRGLIVDESELRKKSIFDSPERSSGSSSRGSFTLIQPKATSLESQNLLPPTEALSHTPLQQTNFLHPAPITSPRLLTLTENYPLASTGQSNTPQLLQSNRRPIPGKMTARNSSGPPNSSRVTPIYPTATPASFLSPPNTFVPMAPKRRGNVGRAAILQGIASGSAQFVDAIAKRYGDELNSSVPIPARLMHLFSYTNATSANPITLAVKASSSELVRGLIEADADVFTTDSEGRTLLHQIFLPLPGDIDIADAENWPQPFRLPELARPSMTIMPSPRSSVLQTPRINEHEPLTISRVKPGKCRLIEAAQTPWLMNMDNRATIIELLVCAGLSPSIRDAAGKYASDYAREWLWQAHRELEESDTSLTDKISACCVRAACLSLLTLEDYLRLSYLAPLTTNYKVRKLVKPCFDFEVDGRHVMINSALLKDNCTPERILPMVRGKCSSKKQTVLRKSILLHQPADPLVLFLSFARHHKDHPGPLRILEFLGAGFIDPEIEETVQSAR